MAEPVTTRKMSRVMRTVLLSPAVILVASGIRLLIIANYDPVAATSIGSSGGVTGTLLGTIVPLIPQYLPLLALIFLAFRRFMACGLTLAGVAIISPTYTTLVGAWHDTARQFANFEWSDSRLALGYGCVVAVIFAFDHRDSIVAEFSSAGEDESSPPEDDQQSALLNAFYARISLLVIYAVGGAVIAGAFGAASFFCSSLFRVPYSIRTIAATMQKPWMPSEEVDLKSGRVLVGYTVTVKDNWYIFLEEKTRIIDYLHADDVKARTPCRIDSALALNRPPLISLIRVPRHTVPQCPGFPLVLKLPHIRPDLYG